MKYFDLSEKGNDAEILQHVNHQQKLNSLLKVNRQERSKVVLSKQPQSFEQGLHYVDAKKKFTDTNAKHKIAETDSQTAEQINCLS